MARVKLTLPSTFVFKTEIPIRIGDINYGGHLGNDALLSIVHEARIQFLRSFDYTELDIEGNAIMMTDAVISYTAEGFYGDILVAEIGVIDFQMTNCDFVFRFTNKKTGKEVARVKTGIVFVDPQTHKISTIPAEFQKKCNAVSISFAKQSPL